MNKDTGPMRTPPQRMPHKSHGNTGNMSQQNAPDQLNQVNISAFCHLL